MNVRQNVVSGFGWELKQNHSNWSTAQKIASVQCCGSPSLLYSFIRPDESTLGTFTRESTRFTVRAAVDRVRGQSSSVMLVRN